MNFTRLHIKILEMENQPKRNRQRLKYAHIMAGSEVELNMYRAQVKTWVISTYHKWRCCACPISNKIKVFSVCRKLLCKRRLLSKSTNRQLIKSRKSKTRLVIFDFSWAINHVQIFNLKRHLGIEKIERWGEVVEKANGVRISCFVSNSKVKIFNIILSAIKAAYGKIDKEVDKFKKIDSQLSQKLTEESKKVKNLQKELEVTIFSYDLSYRARHCMSTCSIKSYLRVSGQEIGKI